MNLYIFKTKRYMEIYIIWPCYLYFFYKHNMHTLNIYKIIQNINPLSNIIMSRDINYYSVQ